MSPAPGSNRFTATACLLVALLVMVAVHGTAVSAYGRVPVGHQPGAPSVFITRAADVRSGPGRDYLILAVAQPGEQFPLLGRSSDRGWWRIDFGGQPAWLPAAAARAHAETQIATVTVRSAN